MNESQFLQEGFVRQSQMLHQALTLCGQRRSLALVLGKDGVIKSRFGKEEEWSRAAGGIIFRLRPASSSQFHRLEVSCPVCGKFVSAGRLHQHANVHVRYLVRFGDESPLRNSIYYQNWYVDAEGYWHRMPREFQRSFPSLPTGF